jgi:hypothetical protein
MVTKQSFSRITAELELAMELGNPAAKLAICLLSKDL